MAIPEDINIFFTRLRISDPVEFTGTAGVDIRTGGRGSDYMNGLGGADILNGGDGNDYVEGGAGIDVLVGGNGSDTLGYFSATSGVTVLLAAVGTGTGGNLAYGVDVVSGFENVVGSQHNDTITGDAGNNFLIGLGGNDTLNGGDGDDYINGGVGNDIINGGLGSNRMFGGPGDDRFVFSEMSGLQIIEDFNVSITHDIIDLSAIDADPNTLGDQAFVEGSDGLGGIILDGHALIARSTTGVVMDMILYDINLQNYDSIIA